MGRASSMSSPYSAGSFYFARGLWAISTVIVTAILIYFAIHLHSDGFKLPYAFVIVSGHDKNPEHYYNVFFANV